MEIRTRKVIRRYVSGDGGGTYKRPKVFEPDEYCYKRYAQQNRSDERRSPTYRIIETREPREPLRPRASLNTLWRGDLAPARSQPFKMRMPYINRVVPARDHYEPKSRGRTSRPFVVDPVPEIRYAWPKSERSKPLSPEIRSISPRKPSLRRPLDRERNRTVAADDTLRESRSLKRPMGTRPLRERSPVVEREPARLRSRAAEIHQAPERIRERGGSLGRRQVRFAEDINDEEYGNRSRGRSGYQQPERDDDFRETFRRRVHELREPQDRYRRTNLEAPAKSRLSERSHLRPRIIQDGHREISEVGDRFRTAARRQRGQGRYLYDFVPHSSSRQRRRLDDILEDDSYPLRTVSRRYGKRWR